LPLFYQPGIPDGVHHLDQDESRHAVKVLRLKEGDPLSITDGKGVMYEAQILRADFPKCTFRILNTRIQPPKKFHRHIAIAPTKNADRIEWFVEKAVELGIDQISFVLCRNAERESLNMERIEKIAVSAMKQSQQAWLPTLAALHPFKDILTSSTDQKFIAFVDPENPQHLKSLVRPGGRYLVLIGPEGDFSPEELQLALDSGFQKVSLGGTRLRTETAGLAACHILNLANP
jgi:16S rRNA (uracil1498-N3)-methyltransferase